MENKQNNLSQVLDSISKNFSTRNLKSEIKLGKEKENFQLEKENFQNEQKQFKKQKFILDGGNEEKFEEYNEKIEKAKKAGLDPKDLNLSNFFNEKLSKTNQNQTETEKSTNTIPSFKNEQKIFVSKNIKHSPKVDFNE